MGLAFRAEPMPNLRGSLFSLSGRKSNRINGVGWLAAELLPNSGWLERRTLGVVDMSQFDPYSDVGIDDNQTTAT
jgi:hypothetical protein